MPRQTCAGQRGVAGHRERIIDRSAWIATDASSYVSTQEAAPGPGPRVPCPHAHTRGAPYPAPPARARPDAADCLSRRGPACRRSGRNDVRREERLRRRADFESVRVEGRIVSDQLLVMGFSRSNGSRTRFGLAVGRRVGSAVVRNRVKRRLREAIRSLSFRDGWNVTVSARERAASADYWRLRASVETLARRSGLLADTNQ